MEFAIVNLVSRCVMRLNPLENRITHSRLASDHTVSPKHVSDYCLVIAFFTLIVILQLTSLPVFAQQGARDYYAARTTDAEKELFKNVELYHLGPGREAMAKGRYQVALNEFEFILRYYPNHPQMLNLVSELCLKWKSPSCESAAEGWFRKALEINPDAAQSYVVQALHLHRKKQLEAAIKAYLRAIDLEPDSRNAHYNLGLAYADLKQYDQANLHAQKSYALGVTLPGLRTRLEKVGKWNPNVSLPASETKPAAEPSPPPSVDKAPD